MMRSQRQKGSKRMKRYETMSKAEIVDFLAKAECPPGKHYESDDCANCFDCLSDYMNEEIRPNQVNVFEIMLAPDFTTDLEEYKTAVKRRDEYLKHQKVLRAMVLKEYDMLHRHSQMSFRECCYSIAWDYNLSPRVIAAIIMERETAKQEE